MGAESSKGTQDVLDYGCNACLEDNIATVAIVYCKACTKFYCGKCIHLHTKLFKTHRLYGRDNIHNWPNSRKTEHFLERCEIHRNEKLVMFCEEQRQLCCSTCFFESHRECTNVSLINEVAKSQSPKDFDQIISDMKTIHDNLMGLYNKQEDELQTQQKAYNKNLKEIREARTNINLALDELEQITLKELYEVTISNKASLKKDVDDCVTFQAELRFLSDTVNNVSKKGRQDMSFIAYMKCQTKLQEAEAYLLDSSRKIANPVGTSSVFQINRAIVQYIRKQPGLAKIVKITAGACQTAGNSEPEQKNQEKEISVSGKTEKNVKIQSDTRESSEVTAFCDVADGRILVADYYNKTVKMLDEHFQFVSQFLVSNYICDMCPINPNDVAVAVNEGKAYWLQFISVTDGKLVKGRKLEFPHRCQGIAHNQGNLYVTSCTALYQYTLDGTLLKILYQDTSGGNRVYMCAVSPSGDRIFVTNHIQNKLLTLSSDGSVLSIFTDRELKRPAGIHVTDAGQVLVCGCLSDTVIQVDSDGKKKIATLAATKDGVKQPISVYYSKNAKAVIVGQLSNYKILLLQVKGQD